MNSDDVTMTVEQVGLLEIVVIACAADPLICVVIGPRDPEYAALRARIEEGR